MKKKYGLIQNTVTVLGGVMKYNRAVLLLILANTCITAVTPFIGILFPRQILEELMTEGRPERLIRLLALFFLASSFAAYAVHFLKGLFMPQPVRVTRPYMDKLYRKCMEISFQCTEDPDFLNSVETAAKGGGRDNFEGISGMLHKWFEAPGAVIALWGYISLIARLHPLILLYLAAGLGIHSILALLQRKYQHKKQETLVGMERRAGYVYDIMYDFSYGKEIRLYGLSDWLGDVFLYYRDQVRRGKEAIKRFELSAAWVDVLFSLGREGIVYIYLVWIVTENRLTIADFTMYTAAIAGFRGAFEIVAGHIADLYRLSMQVSDYRNFMAWPDQMAQVQEKVSIPQAPYEFEFRNVSWRYPGSSHYVLKNLNLTIPRGKSIALVGHNGAGKSTLIKLLVRLYDVTEGEILCNGINIKKFDREAYYGLFSAVFQEVLPLGFSVADNIGVSDGEQKDRQRVEKCIRKAGLAEKVAGLKYGADTCVLKAMDDEGVTFSGGEAQKLMIARALYKDGGVMVLDEPTAALDPLAEQEIYESFQSLTENKTTIYVSHRMASTRFCDGIAVLENGRLAEYGTHEELVGRNGKYAEMFRVQAKYYRKEGVGQR